MHWGQLVVGPPGSGKTTYCSGLVAFLHALHRPVALVNLDPAAEPPAADAPSRTVCVTELVSVDDVARRYALGPNGAMLFALEYVERNVDWLLSALATRCAGRFVVFDCPGQIELFTHHTALPAILARLERAHYRLACVNLVDSVYCADPTNFIAATLVSLSTMLHLQLPHVNVLSKIDLVERSAPLPFALDYYTDVLDLSFLVDHLRREQLGLRDDDDDDDDGGGGGGGGGGGNRNNNIDVDDDDNNNTDNDTSRPDDSHALSPAPRTHAATAHARRFARLNAALAELVEDASLVSFVPLNIESRASLYALLKATDKACGYVVGALDAREGETVRDTAPASANDEWSAENAATTAQERYGVADVVFERETTTATAATTTSTTTTTTATTTSAAAATTTTTTTTTAAAAAARGSPTMNDDRGS